METHDLPLSGITVLDFTQVEFGPIATQTLADFGATVIKVERPGVGDIIRHIDKHAETPDSSAYYLSLNRNKKSICVDIKSEAGRNVLKDMLQSVDVLVENFRPGVLDKVGLGFEELHAAFPRLVYASGSGFGHTGPMAKKGGQDMLAQSLSGAAHHARDNEGRPQLHPVSFADFGAGQALVQGILLALLERHKSGLGQQVHVNLFDTMLFAQLQELTQWKLRHEETNFMKDNLAGIFKTLDGWVTVVGLFRDNPLRDICRALEVDDLSAQARFADLQLQLKNRDALWPLLDGALGQYTTDECVRRLDLVDILCAPVLNYDEVVAHEQVAVNEIITTAKHPDLGEISLIRAPIRLSRSPRLVDAPPPNLGADTDDVLARFAGLDDDRIQQLRQTRAIA